MNSQWSKIIPEALRQVREKRGIVHQITNAVTVRDCANATLSIGASPIMADNPAETADITGLSQALVLNIGTIQPNTLEAMLNAGRRANELAIPVLLDPVGAGATSVRKNAVYTLLNELSISVLRCNAGELAAVFDAEYQIGGVDSPTGIANVKEMAVDIARRYHTVVAVTGEIDTVTDGNATFTLHNGVSLLPQLTGTGCMTSALTGAFLTANNPLVAAVCGITYMSVCGEEAFARLSSKDGLGSFSVYLHDAMSRMKPKRLGRKAVVK